MTDVYGEPNIYSSVYEFYTLMQIGSPGENGSNARKMLRRLSHIAGDQTDILERTDYFARQEAKRLEAA